LNNRNQQPETAMALTGTITMFNVSDADAILVELHQDGKDLVIVVDGGRKGDYERCMKGPLREALYKANKKEGEGPDLVILTHYDADHILGITELVKEYGTGIGQLWAHSPPEDFTESRSFLEALKGRVIKDQGFFNKRTDILNEHSMLKEDHLQDAAVELLESLPQLRELERLFQKQTTPVFAGKIYEGWPIKVLGPSQEYYSNLFQSRKSTVDLLITEALNQKVANAHLIEREARRNMVKARIVEDRDEELSPCQELQNVRDRSMSNTNLASIIFSIEASEGRYLFTGDAGVPSFQKVLEQDKLEAVHWLKVPHHGSERNLTPELISLMKPQYADCSGGKDYQDDHVLECIGKNARSRRKVRSTYWEKKHLQFSIGSAILGH